MGEDYKTGVIGLSAILFWLCVYALAQAAPKFVGNTFVNMATEFDYITESYEEHAAKNDSLVMNFNYTYDYMDKEVVQAAKEIVEEKAQKKVEQETKEETLRRNDLVEVISDIKLNDGYTKRSVNLALMGDDFSEDEVNAMAQYIAMTMKTMLTDRRLEKEHVPTYKFKQFYDINLSERPY